MANRPKRRVPDVLLADHRRAGESQFVMAGKAFLAFDARIDEGLETLVARWAPFAAPAASFVRRGTCLAPRPSESQP